jgi:ABC-type Fe3+ transport system substrate-binding protein
MMTGSTRGKALAFFLGLGLVTPLILSAHAADQALIDAAKKEGQVTWYTAQIIPQIVRPIAELFEKKYGIRVTYVRANAAEIALRVTNEAKAGKIQASIVDGTQTSVILKKAGLAMKWVPDVNLPKELFDPEGYWVANNLYVLTPGFNTNLVPKGTEPKTFQDLLDPKWKGKMAWNTSPSSSAGQGFVGAVIHAMGEDKARPYLAQLAKQNITGLSVSGRQVLDLVIAGEYPIALEIFNNHAVTSARLGAPVSWIKMEPALLVYSAMSVLKDAPSPNAGKLLIDYIVSLEGQKVFADAGELPVHPDVPPKDPTLRPDGVNFKATFLSPEELDKQLPRWTDLYNEYFR